MTSLKNSLKRMWNDERGAMGTVEIVLLIAVAAIMLFFLAKNLFPQTINKVEKNVTSLIEFDMSTTNSGGASQ